jgi:hypothetical protein
MQGRAVSWRLEDREIAEGEWKMKLLIESELERVKAELRDKDLEMAAMVDQTCACQRDDSNVGFSSFCQAHEEWRDAAIASVKAERDAAIARAEVVVRHQRKEIDGWALIVEKYEAKADLCDRMGLVLAWYVANYVDNRNGDWACIQCKPHSDQIAEGFICHVHAAPVLLAEWEGRK